MCKLNRDDRSSIRHALMHLEANKIIQDGTWTGGGWYCGNKVPLFKRHVKALALLRSLCEGKGASKGD